jgi:exonuclease SbcC
LEKQQAIAGLAAVQEQRDMHDRARPGGLPQELTPATILDRLAELGAAMTHRQTERNHAQAILINQQATASKNAAALAALKEAADRAEVWLVLHDLIGVKNGERFKIFAQALNLQHLLRQANHHLARLNKRYQLVPVFDAATQLPTLQFEVSDSWQSGRPRALRTLSGGEGFLVSLALALGLSDLRTSRMPIETLLLDEGFGTLDPKTLDTALAALAALQADGRQVGLISHVVGLDERIEARVIVEPVGEGRSSVRCEMG